MEPWILEFRSEGMRVPYGATIVQAGYPGEVVEAVHDIIKSFPDDEWNVADIRLQLNELGFNVVPAGYVSVYI